MASPSHYITYEGAQRLQQELNFLWKEKRPAVTRAVSAAAALGDRSENADYIYGKKQLREIDKRVRFLSKRLDELTIVHEPPQDQSRVFFGAWVTIEDEQGQAQCYRLVGSDEYDPARHWISLHSPMAKALLGRSLDDEIEVVLPRGRGHYTIIAIHYRGDSSQPFIKPEWA
ncbi:transcription elongation factor GreB [Ectothiorhodospiraceae bacterium BW-2]|nr:transcription elongation factor GreB [Ectothiorhodospiraceae bacterium BW-2]